MPNSDHGLCGQMRSYFPTLGYAKREEDMPKAQVQITGRPGKREKSLHPLLAKPLNREIE